MSKGKFKYLSLCLLVLLCAFFFGCESKTPVEAIYFAEEEITLLVGETYTPQIGFTPTYATNKNYTLFSSNEAVVSIDSQKITALKEGSAIVRVVSEDNELHEDAFNVVVKKTPTKLATPQLNFNPANQTFTFDAVANAGSYTIKINSQEINLGNNNSFSLAEFNARYGIAYDRVLNCQVMANAPTYSGAYEASDFSREHKIYVSSDVTNLNLKNGHLTFNSTPAGNYIVRVGEKSFTTSENDIDLTSVQLDNNNFYDVTVTATVPNADRQPNVNYYSSNAVSTRAFALSSLDVELTGSIARWQNLAFVGNYKVFVDNQLVGETKNNFFDLSAWADFGNIVAREENYNLRVEPEIETGALNVIKTETSFGEILFNRVQTPTLNATNNKILWDEIAEVSSYNYTLEYAEKYSAAVSGTTFSLDNYPSNTDYTFTLSATGKKQGEVYLLSSFPTEIVIHKQATVEPYIENGVLKFSSTAGEKYRVEFSLDGTTVLTETISSTGDVEFNLKELAFEPGQHTIKVVHLGDGTTVFDSDSTSVEFNMFEDALTLAIQTAQIDVTTTEINKDATIKLQVVGEGVDFTITGTHYDINSTDIEAEYYLPAGHYLVYVYVLGDESKNFSIANDGKSELVAEFEVLDVPVLDVLDKTTPNLTWQEIDNANNYNVFINGELKENVTTNSYNFEIESQIKVCVQAVGNGSLTMNSVKSTELEINKLATPTLTYDKTTGVISKTDTNDSAIVLEYVLLHNGEQISYDFVSPFANFVVENNEFKLTAIAIDRAGNVVYLNSDEFVLNIFKTDATSDISVDSNNSLVIAPTNQTEEQELNLIIKQNSNVYYLNYAGNNTISTDDEAIKLTYTYSDGIYQIELLNSDFTPKNSIFEENFSVIAKFGSKSETGVDSNLSDEVLIVIKQKTTIARQAQNLTIALVSATDRAENFDLLINDSVVLPLPENTIVDNDNGVLIFPADYVFDNVEGEIDSIAVITKNIDSQINIPTLSVKGENSFIARASAVALTENKNNNSNNNSVVISFAIDTNSYNKTYEVSVFNGSESNRLNEQKRIFTNLDATDGVISFELDNYSLTGEIFVVVKTLVADSVVEGDKTTFIFNSINSNIIAKTKIEEVGSIYVNNGVLHFDEVSNAVGYEIYDLTGGTEQKLNANLVTTNSYDLTGVSGSAIIAVKAISSEQFTNSNMSDSVRVNKLIAPIVSVLAGEISVELSADAYNLFTQDEVDIVLRVKNGSNIFNLTKDSFGVTTESGRVLIEARMLLTYGVNSPLSEDLVFSLVVNYTEPDEEIYYLNSNTTNFTAYGIFAPTNLVKNSTTSDTDEIVDNISFTPSANNILDGSELTLGYVFQIVVNGEAFLSTDSRLKYHNGTEVVSYPLVILNSNFVFPYGYDKNGSGTIEENERFISGEIAIAIKSVAKSVGGLNVLNSKFSEPLVFTILNKPVISAYEGSLQWSLDNKATSYVVRVYENDLTTLKQKDSLTISSFEFLNEIFNDYYGLFGVSVQAISTDKLVVNSAESDIVMVYRMPEATNARIDDGNLIITANPYFSLAEINFVDDVTGRTETIRFDRTLAANKELTNLEVQIWNEYDISKVDELYTSRDFIVTTLTDEILNILANRSYTINVRLIGNSITGMPVISSKQSQNLGTLNATKLATSLTEVKSGVVKFDYLSDYSSISMNYNFNNQSADNIPAFWKTARVFKIQINAQSEHFIYAVDYKTFKSAVETGVLNSSDYELLTNMSGLYAYVKYSYIQDGQTKYLYFNVYEDNILNLRENDVLYYYPINVEKKEGEIVFTGASDKDSFRTIDIATGGSFVVNLSLLGGDSYLDERHLGYLTSNQTNLNTFIRYSENYLSTANGQLVIGDLCFTDNDGNVIDYPVYKLGVNLLNDDNKEYIYLYYDAMDEAQAREIAGDLDARFFKLNRVDDRLIFDFAEHFDAGSYQIDIQTIAGIGVNGAIGADYLLNSKRPTSNNVVKKISSTDFALDGGTLQFNLAYVEGNSGNLYIENYEISLTDKTINRKYVYNIARNSEGVKIDGNILIYELPSKIAVGDEIVQISNNHSYSIKVKALALDNQFIINATYNKANGEDKLFNFVRSEGVGEQVRIENGKLAFKVQDLTNYVLARIKLEFVDSNNETQVISITTAGERVNDLNGDYLYHTYTFSDNRYRIDGTNSSVYISSDIDYTITITILGNSSGSNAMVNSCPSTEIVARRLRTLEENEIYSLNGLLTWSSVDSAVAYEVILTGAQTYTFKVPTNSLDLVATKDNQDRFVPAGEYVVSVRPLGNELITARATVVSGAFKKLESVTGIEIDQDNKNNLIWNEVTGANSYLVEFVYGDTVARKTTEVASVDVPDDLTGNYQVNVTALYLGSSKVFNSDATTFVSSKDRPTPVSAISFDEEEKIFYWTTNADFLSTDKFRINYNFEEYVYERDLIVTSPVKPVSILIDSTNSFVKDGFTFYYFKPEVMGVYTNLTVQVEREQTLLSSAVLSADQNINMFAYGAGTEENPYRIMTASQLINIALRNSAHFELISSIDLSNIDVKDRVNKYGAIISETFSGSLVSNSNYVLYGLNDLALNGQANFALFKTLNNANISNLSIGLNDSATIITNSFATDRQDVVKLSLIATDSYNSTLTNISINNTTIIIDGAGRLRREVYVAGVVANANNTNFVGLNVNLTIQFNAYFTSSTYVAGAVANATNCNITKGEQNNSINFTLTKQNAELTMNSVGGAVARFTGDNAHNFEISDTDVIVNLTGVKATYLGGLIGLNMKGKISSCFTSGTIQLSNAGNINIGGVTGVSSSALITNSGTSVQFNIRVSDMAVGTNLGVLSGGLTTDGAVECRIENCYSTYEVATQTSIDLGELTLGIYGSNSENNVNIVNWQNRVS